MNNAIVFLICQKVENQQYTRTFQLVLCLVIQNMSRAIHWWLVLNFIRKPNQLIMSKFKQTKEYTFQLKFVYVAKVQAAECYVCLTLKKMKITIVLQIKRIYVKFLEEFMKTDYHWKQAWHTSNQCFKPSLPAYSNNNFIVIIFCVLFWMSIQQTKEICKRIKAHANYLIHINQISYETHARLLALTKTIFLILSVMVWCVMLITHLNHIKLARLLMSHALSVNNVDTWHVPNNSGEYSYVVNKNMQCTQLYIYLHVYISAFTDF